MTKKYNEISKKYYEFWIKNSGYKERMKLLEVDFSKPWWFIIWQQKWLVLLVMSGEAISDISWVLLPILLGMAIEQKSFEFLAWIVGIRILLVFIVHIQFYFNSILQIQCMQSVAFAANSFLLKVDPIFHSTRSSGQIISKVNRGSSNYEDLLDIITFQIIPIVLGAGTVIVSLFFTDWKIGLIAAGFILFLTIANIITQFLHGMAFEPEILKLEDNITASQVENLQQSSFIRSVFATTEQLQKFEVQNMELMYKKGAGWFAIGCSWVLLLATYFLSILVIGRMLIEQIAISNISTTTAIALITTYLAGTTNLLSIGHNTRRFITVYTHITDLFSFVRGFGKQSFPVLKETP